MACAGCGKSSKTITSPKNAPSGPKRGGQQMQRVMRKESGAGGGRTPISHAAAGKRTGGQMMQKRMR